MGNDDEAVYYKILEELQLRPVLVIADNDFQDFLLDKKLSFRVVTNNSII